METRPEAAQTEPYAELVKAFHLMWDSFPSPSTLLKKDRTVLACNPAAVKRGFEVGSKCYQMSGDSSVHKHCKANAALREQTSQRALVYAPARNTVSDSYWLPVPGEKDIYVHTVINISEFAKPELFKE